MTLQNIKIALRTDDLSNWTSVNPTLNQGEIAIVNDTSASITRVKIGNGISSFNELPYFGQPKFITDLLEAKSIQADNISQGIHAASVPYGLAAGAYLCANANFSQALGFDSQSMSSDTYSFVWNGDDTRAIGDYYQSHGKGTFNINSLSGLSGVYIGEQTLPEIISAESISAVCEIEYYLDEWQWPATLQIDGDIYYYAPSYSWVEQNGDTQKKYYIPYLNYSAGEWEFSSDLCYYASDYWEYAPSGMCPYGTVQGTEDALSLSFDTIIEDLQTHIQVNISRQIVPGKNKHGLARLIDISADLSAYELKSDMFTDVSSIVLSNEIHTSSLTWNPVQLWGDDVTISIDNGYIKIIVNGSGGYGYDYQFDPSQTTYIWQAGNDWAGEDNITAIYSPAYSKNALGLATLADISSIPTEALSAGTLARTETRWICDPAYGVGGAALSVVTDEANRSIYLYSDGYQCSISKPYDPAKTTYVWDGTETDMGQSVTATYSPSQNILGLVTYPDISSFSVQQISAAVTKNVPVYDYSSLSITVIPQTVDNKEISVAIEDGQIKPTLDGSIVGSNIKTFFNEPYVYTWGQYDWEGGIDLSAICTYDTHYVNQIGLAMLSDVTGVSAQLSDYYVKSETSSAAEISTALEQKSKVMFVEWED